MVKKSLRDGSGLKKFEEMLMAQNVSPDLAKTLCHERSNLYQILPIAERKTKLTAGHSGIVSSLNALALANLLTELGAGRLKPTDKVDHGVGLVLEVQVGDFVKKDENWGTLYHSRPLTDQQVAVLKNAASIEPGNVESKRPLGSRLIDVIRPN